MEHSVFIKILQGTPHRHTFQSSVIGHLTSITVTISPIFSAEYVKIRHSGIVSCWNKYECVRWPFIECIGIEGSNAC